MQDGNGDGMHDGNGGGMEDGDGVAALISDLHWQLDQMGPRGVKDSSGNPYKPSYYKRGLKTAIEGGDLAVVEYVRRSLSRSAGDGYKKLEDADSLDLACEALVADADKPYAHLFSDADRAAARARLAPHIKTIEARKAARTERIDTRRSELPTDVEELRALAAHPAGDEDAIAVNSAILGLDPQDIVATIRLGRAHEGLGQLEAAIEVFRAAIALDPKNPIATRRLRDLERRQGG